MEFYTWASTVAFRSDEGAVSLCVPSCSGQAVAHFNLDIGKLVVIASVELKVETALGHRSHPEAATEVEEPSLPPSLFE